MSNSIHILVYLVSLVYLVYLVKSFISNQLFISWNTMLPRSPTRLLV
jgi:hypothetical protein